ncbi:MAG: AvaI/BsoBI family type II restriction endonuclease [Pseudanabaenaceae cyanobacterium bins.39]|nr:AvaI/BsoBI family type II restriction endonuclease [Pseudanabaenaceae cyanobacterium bins.39]
MNNVNVLSAASLITTPEARRSGFLEYALRRNKEAIPFIDKAKALKATLQAHTNQPHDILKIIKIRESLLESAGISVKAKAHLSNSDKERLLIDFIDKVLIPCGQEYIDEVIYRYLLTSGDALGGKMRNIVGSIANEKLNRFVISQLQICQIDFYFATNSGFINSTEYTLDIAESIKAIKWQTVNGEQRLLIYNVNVPQVSKNIDIVLLNKSIEVTKGKNLKAILDDSKNYLAIGELKGGIDPAGADEHWKTANTALGRVRVAFNNQLPLIFVGAAIESAMAVEIFNQYQSGDLANCANLTNDEQLALLCEWLVNL